MELARVSLPMVAFAFTGVFYNFPFPSMLSSDLLPYFRCLPKQYALQDGTVEFTPKYISHSSLIHTDSLSILKGSQSALGKPGINLS